MCSRCEGRLLYGAFCINKVVIQLLNPARIIKSSKRRNIHTGKLRPSIICLLLIMVRSSNWHLTSFKMKNKGRLSSMDFNLEKLRARPPTFTVCRLRWKHLETLGKDCKDSDSLWLLLTTMLPLGRLPWHSGFSKTVNQVKRPKYHRISSSLQSNWGPKTKSEDYIRPPPFLLQQNANDNPCVYPSRKPTLKQSAIAEWHIQPWLMPNVALKKERPHTYLSAWEARRKMLSPWPIKWRSEPAAKVEWTRENEANIHNF